MREKILIESYLNDIVYIESADKYCRIVLKENESIYIRNSMNKLQMKLSAYGFLRVSRFAIVNLRYVRKVAMELELSNGKKIKVAKGNVKHIKEKWKTFVENNKNHFFRIS